MSSSGPTELRIPIVIGTALVALVVVIVLFRDFGIGWDEPAQAEYGEMVFRYFASGFSDTQCNGYEPLNMYGPLFEWVAAAVCRLSPARTYEIRHLLCALTALLALAGVAQFARRLPGASRLSIGLSAWLLATMPAFFGHAFINSKDIPFACTFVWTMLTWCVLLTGGGSSWRPWICAGLATGVCLAVRPGGFPVLMLILLGFVLAARFAGTPVGEGRGAGLARPAIVVLMAWAIMVIPWPWAHLSPLLNPIRAMREASAFSFVYPVQFNGQLYDSNILPRYYLPEFLLITAPPALLICAVIGLGLLVHALIRRPVPRTHRPLLILFCWLFAPIAVVVLRRPNLYDGMRHFLFLLPAVAIIAGWGGARLWQLLRARTSGPVAWGMILLMAASPLPALVRLHPYEYAYFNFLAGGMKNVQDRFETDYWLLGYKEAAEWINKNGTPSGTKSRIVVLAAANAYAEDCIKHYLRSDSRVLTSLDIVPDRDLPPWVDYYVGTTRYGLDKNYPDAPIVHTIGRAGAAFAVIKKRGGA